MKKKQTQEGQPYFFTTDYGVDTLALNIISEVSAVPNASSMTMREKLWEAAIIHIEKNLYSNDMLFTRPTHISPNETDYERAIHWVDVAVNAILNSVKNKETRMDFNPVDEKSNGKGLTRYKTAGGDFILKGILSPTIMFLSRPDYLKLDEMVKDMLGVNLNELTCQQFYQLQNDLATDKREIIKHLPSLKSGFLPDNYGKENTKVQEKKMMFTQLLRNQRVGNQDKPIDNSSSTMSVFDGI